MGGLFRDARDEPGSSSDPDAENKPIVNIDPQEDPGETSKSIDLLRT